MQVPSRAAATLAGSRERMAFEVLGMSGAIRAAVTAGRRGRRMFLTCGMARALAVWRVTGLGHRRPGGDSRRLSGRSARHDTWGQKRLGLDAEPEGGISESGLEDPMSHRPPQKSHVMPSLFQALRKKIKAPRQDRHPSAPALTIRKDRRRGQTTPIHRIQEAVGPKRPPDESAQLGEM